MSVFIILGARHIRITEHWLHVRLFWKLPLHFASINTGPNKVFNGFRFRIKYLLLEEND